MMTALSPLEAQAVAMEAFSDPAFFMRTFLPQWFYLPMPWVHRGMLAILARQTDWLLKFGPEEWPKASGVWDEKQLDKILRHFVWKEDPSSALCEAMPIFEAERQASGKIHALHLAVSDRMLFIMPRGVSKTTLVNGHNLREIARHEAPFMVYLSESATHAETQLLNVRREIEGNILFNAVFGQKKPERSDPERWSQNTLQTTDGIVISARGRGGQVRGQNVGAKRPSDIILDDVEDKESVKTAEQRAKALDWLKGDVEQALPQIGNLRGRIIILGTLLHPEAMLPTLAKTPEWLSIQFGAKDPDGEMLWSHYMTEAQYQAKRVSFQRLRKLNLFNLEYCSSVRAEDDGSIFQEKFFKYSPLTTEEFKAFPARAIVVDPAISDKKDSDFCAFAVVGMSTKGQIHIQEVYLERGMHPRDQVNKYFELHFAYDCNKHGIETVAYQKALLHLMKEEMFRRGKQLGPSAYFEIEAIAHGRTSKEERIEGILAPRYAAGYITHNHVLAEYESQLLDYPSGKKDGPDAVAMAVQLLDPFAAFAYDPESSDEGKLEKDQFRPIDEEIPGWASAP
jgi:hypothetical protein